MHTYIQTYVGGAPLSPHVHTQKVGKQPPSPLLSLCHMVKIDPNPKMGSKSQIYRERGDPKFFVRDPPPLRVRDPLPYA